MRECARAVVFGFKAGGGDRSHIAYTHTYLLTHPYVNKRPSSLGALPSFAGKHEASAVYAPYT